MKKTIYIITLLLLTGCTSQKKLAYLNNLPETGGDQFFPMDIPEYRIQNRDVLYITLKAMDSDGTILDYMAAGNMGLSSMQGEGGGFLFGYNVDENGNINLPIIGMIYVEGKTILEIRTLLQKEFEKKYKNVFLDCKLLSFKFTVIGEVRNPGTFINYNNYLTVFEAIGRAGGIDDFGKRDRITVIRTKEKGTQVLTMNVQDKNILNSQGYFLLPNDVLIIEPQKRKVFNLNLPLISFIVPTVTSAITTTLLLINYLK